MLGVGTIVRKAVRDSNHGPIRSEAFALPSELSDLNRFLGKLWVRKLGKIF